MPAWWLIAVFSLNALAIWGLSQGRYVVSKHGQLQPAFGELQEFSCFLIAGTIVAQLWVHGNAVSYAATIHATLFSVALLDLNVTLHFLVNDVFMALFFGIAAKELAEAVMKPNGPLRGIHAILPMMACAGGVIGPAIAYRSLCTTEMSGAWAVPCSTDIAFAWLGARIIWGHAHPAVTFLLAVAVADDFVGMGVIALFYPQQTFDWFGVVVLAAGMSTAFAMSRLATGRIQLLRNWQFFLVPAAICWLGLHLAGLHSALAMVFVVPFIPMAGRDVGIFAEQQSTALWLPHRFLRLDRGTDIANRPDRSTLDPINRFDLAVRPWVDTGLFFFGLANAGVAWYGSNAWNQNSWAVFLGLGIGKTLGIGVMTALGYVFVRLLLRRKSTPIGLEVVQLLKWRDVPLVGLLGAMGFTVALFTADAAGAAPSLKLGAMASFVYLGIAVLVGRQIVPPKDRQELPLVAAPLNRDPQDTEISADEKRSGGEGTNVARAQTARYKKLAITNPFRISCLIVWMTRST